MSDVSVADGWASWMVDLDVLNSFLQRGLKKKYAVTRLLYFLSMYRTEEQDICLVYAGHSVRFWSDSFKPWLG